MSRIYFTDYDDMEKQTLNLLLTEPDGFHRDWIKEMLRVMEERWLEDFDRGYEEAITDIVNTMKRDGRKSIGFRWLGDNFGC